MAFKALLVKPLAALLATLKPIPPGTAICIIDSVSLPINLSSATSSKGFILSKYSSTSAAIFESAPRSINSAPSDIIPSGTFIAPDTRPAPRALYQLTSLSCSAEFKLYSAIKPSIYFCNRLNIFRN